jgi:hypothetical protein
MGSPKAYMALVVGLRPPLPLLPGDTTLVTVRVGRGGPRLAAAAPALLSASDLTGLEGPVGGVPSWVTVTYTATSEDGSGCTGGHLRRRAGWGAGTRNSTGTLRRAAGVTSWPQTRTQCRNLFPGARARACVSVRRRTQHRGKVVNVKNTSTQRQQSGAAAGRQRGLTRERCGTPPPAHRCRRSR